MGTLCLSSPRCYLSAACRHCVPDSVQQVVTRVEVGAVGAEVGPRGCIGDLEGDVRYGDRDGRGCCSKEREVLEAAAELVVRHGISARSCRSDVSKDKHHRWCRMNLSCLTTALSSSMLRKMLDPMSRFPPRCKYP